MYKSIFYAVRLYRPVIKCCQMLFCCWWTVQVKIITRMKACDRFEMPQLWSPLFTRAAPALSFTRGAVLASRAPNSLSITKCEVILVCEHHAVKRAYGTMLQLNVLLTSVLHGVTWSAPPRGRVSLLGPRCVGQQVKFNSLLQNTVLINIHGQLWRTWIRI